MIATLFALAVVVLAIKQFQSRRVMRGGLLIAVVALCSASVFAMLLGIVFAYMVPSRPAARVY